MKHEIARLRPVFDGDRYCGALVHTAKGWAAHNIRGDRVAYYQDAARAVDRLRAMATRVST